MNLFSADERASAPTDTMSIYNSIRHMLAGTNQFLQQVEDQLDNLNHRLEGLEGKVFPELIRVNQELATDTVAVKERLAKLLADVDCAIVPEKIRGDRLHQTEFPRLPSMERETTPYYREPWFVALISFLATCAFTLVTSVATFFYLQKKATKAVTRVCREFFEEEVDGETQL